MLIDFHTHSLLSDGCLVPAELVRRAQVNGYTAIGITDHVDMATVEVIAPILIRAAKSLSQNTSFSVLAGIEITHVLPQQILPLVEKARKLGVELIIVHGETIVEPVMPGTNSAAINAAVDIIAHPGFLTVEEAGLALQQGVFLEISFRKGHSLTNGYIASIAKKTGAKLLVGSDAHEPHDLLDEDTYKKLILGTGLDEDSVQEIQANSQDLLNKIISKR
ncbi:histidinol phosphate phosphatase domain-containing protein [Chlamydiota bacterium]